jgi:D-glycero-D-manno-heptose 1,7-bisphosphate phosphatase
MTADFPHLGADRIWREVLVRDKRGPGWAIGKPALFLDRDGVLVDEVHYLHKPEEAKLAPGAVEVLTIANKRATPVVLVTNQAGIGYGYYGWAEFIAVRDKIIADLDRAGVFVDAVFACPHHAKGQPPYGHHDHPCRKPNPGLLLAAAAMMGVDLSRSWMVGDRESDLAAGRNAGLAGAAHLMTGHGSREGERDKALALARPGFSVLAADTLGELIGRIPLLPKPKG